MRAPPALPAFHLQVLSYYYLENWRHTSPPTLFIVYIIKKLRSTAEFFDLLSALDLSGTKATGANVYGTVGTVNYCLYLADVGLPGSVGLAVRVGNVVTKGNALAADTALSHLTPPKIPS